MPRKKQNKFETEEILHNVEVITDKTEHFILKNSKILGILLVAVLVALIGYFAYIKFYLEPNEQAVFEKSITADQYFQKDSMQRAFDGKGYLGYKQLADKYSGTSGGNIAKYKAGIALYNTGKFAEAQKYFEDFDTDEEVLSILKIGAIGDCLVELGKKEEGLEKYQEAIEKSDTDFTKEYFYKKAIMLHLSNKELSKANDLMQAFMTEIPAMEDNPEVQKLQQYIKYSLNGNS